MSWIKQAVSWANFVTFLKETIDELKKSVLQQSRELESLRTQNLMLIERLINQSTTIDKLERRIEGLESSLRVRPSSQSPIALEEQPKMIK